MPSPRDAFELLLVLLLGWMLVAPVHAAHLDHRNVRRTVSADTVTIAGEGLRVGERLPAYRFHAGWQVPIGTVRVEHRVGQEAVVVAEPGNRWPLGRQGRIVTEEAGSVVLDIGAELGLAPGRNLGVYDGRRWLGDVRLTRVEPHRSEAAVTFRADRPLAGLDVTEFRVMTQVVVRDEPPLVVAAQGVLGLGPAIAWAVFRIRARTSPLQRLGDALRAAIARQRRATLAVEALAVGVLVGGFLPSVACQVFASAALHAHAWLPAVPAFDPWPLVRPWKAQLFGGVAAAATGFAAVTGRSPLGAVFAAVAFERAPVARIPTAWKPVATWLLHLVVVSAFGVTLWGFLRANVAAIGELWGPTGPATVPAAFEIAKLVLWSVTLVGCLSGYAHTVAGPLFGQHLRNLDFTLPGWVTTAACYPLLGASVARLVWPRPGLDPVVVGGFCGAFLLVLGLLTNLAYTTAIWNMGTTFGVMADKGLVRHGWFSVVRHPCYTFEALMFVCIEAPGLTTWHEWVGTASVVWLYWLRSEREDAFLAASNPDHAAYRAAVPWRYVPGVW